MKKVFALAIIVNFVGSIFAQNSLTTPSFEDVISLNSVSNAVISPDGRNIVFVMQTVDWEDNRYDRELWLSKDGAKPFQLTNNKTGSSSNPKWSPDGQWISFLSKRNKVNQIHAIRVAGGESFQITKAKKNIGNFEWSPNGQQIAFLQSEDNSKEEEKKKEKYGGFYIEDDEFSLSQLWVMDFDPESLNRMPLPEEMKDSLFNEKLKPKLLIDSVEFSINSFKWSPDGQRIAFEHQPDPLINSFFKADISIFDVQSNTYKILVNNKSYDGLIDWSPFITIY